MGVTSQLAEPFTVISGSVDQTFPSQCDVRFPAFAPALQMRIREALDHPLLRQWYAENLSGREHTKLEPLPTGMVFETAEHRSHFAPSAGSGLYGRDLRALCAHRVRPGAQWAARRNVTDLAASHWADICDIPDGPLPIAAFDERLLRCAFVLCVQGGGYDPSPKAWRSILHGAIPILCDSPVADAYRVLPVVIVPEWVPETLTPKRLANWRDQLAPWFEGEGRRMVLNRLSLDYWWDRVCAGALACEPGDPELAIGSGDAAP